MQIYDWLQLYNAVLGIGVLVVFVDGLVLLSDIWRPWIPVRTRFVLGKIMMPYLVLMSIAVIVGPMVYQYVFTFPPCILCWYSRIFIWPAAFLTIGAVLDNKLEYVSKYIFNFLAAAAVIGVFHYLSQFGVTGDISCGASGQAVSCSGIDIIVFHFITIPLMAVFAATGLIAGVWWMKKNS